MSAAFPSGPATTAVGSVVGYLRTRGVIADGSDRSGETGALVTPLTGGVSGDAVLVQVGAQRVVVKRALERLLVQDEWWAKPERAVTEAAAIEVLHRLTPDETPELLDVDPERFTLVMSAADARWVPWKTRLMNNPLDPVVESSVARTLGTVLGTWHRATASSRHLAARFDDYEAFEQLRVGPFHRTVARRHPRVAAAITTCIDDLERRRDCLIHGDYSPKNVLVSPAGPPGTASRAGLMVLDFEVACYGAAVFDIAYVQCHLILKAVHRPDQRAVFRSVARTLLDAYVEVIAAESGPHLGWHTACLLLARIDGTSPAGYLDERAQDLVRDMALRLLAEDEPAIDQVWDHADELIARGPR